MKKLSSAVLLLIASTAAFAADEDTASGAPLVLAYSEATASYAPENTAVNNTVNAERVLANTLDVVSASLTVALDNFEAPSLPGAKNLDQ